MEEHEFLESLSPAGDRPAPSSYPIPLENLWGVGWGGGSSTAEARGSPALTHAPWGFTPHPGALPRNHFTPHGVGFTSAPPRWGSRCPSPPSAPSRSSERTRRSCRSSAPGSTAWGRGGGEEGAGQAPRPGPGQGRAGPMRSPGTRPDPISNPHSPPAPVRHLPLVHAPHIVQKVQRQHRQPRPRRLHRPPGPASASGPASSAPRRFRPPHCRFRPRPLREAAKGRPWRPGPRTTRRPAPLDAFICNTSK